MSKFPFIILVKLHAPDSHVSGGQRCLAYLLKQGNLHICLCCLPYLCLHAEKEKAKRGVFMRNHPIRTQIWMYFGTKFDALFAWLISHG